ncbi:MAG: PIG-L family deacetylase, partial [Chloroflexota bacterium]
DEGLEPHVVQDVYLAGPEHPNIWVDITAVFEQKIEAILCHTSQIGEPENLEERIKPRLTATDQYGQEVCREEFRVIHVG